MRFTIALFALLVSGFACAADLESRSITVGARTRTYELFVPDNVKGVKDRPLVLMLHGRGGKGKDAAKAYGWMEKAKLEGFVVAFPDALNDPYQDLPTWNYIYDAKYPGADDVTFLMMLIINLKRELSLDPKRVFVAGHSNGAMMAYRVASELSDLVAAVAPVAGSIGPVKPGMYAIKKPKYPVSVIAFHGKKDPVVPYDGSTSFGVRDSLGFWIKQDGCSSEPGAMRPMDDDSLIIETWGNGKNGTEITLVTVGNGGHEWPGWIVQRWEARAPEEKLTATDMIWEFFARHPKRSQ